MIRTRCIGEVGGMIPSRNCGCTRLGVHGGAQMRVRPQVES